jgi:hypothetical protein
LEIRLREQPQDRILNCDETCCQVYPNGLKIWAVKGSSDVSLKFRGNKKDRLTVVATVLAARTKLPLMLRASGKTERCEFSQLGDTKIHWRDHSQSGWMTEEIFIHYLHHLRQYFADELAIWLILDIYTAHRTPRVREVAERLNIHLRYIPSGLTDELQRLDRAAFGAMKVFCRRMFRRAVSNNPSMALNRRTAVQFLVPA